MVRKVICALDTNDKEEAKRIVRRLAGHIGGFKIGHALTLAHGMGVIAELQDAGAHRIFLDLKFHDIPNIVGLAIREASRYHVWMLTLHIVGGPAMMTAAVEEARSADVTEAPLLVGVAVLTSIDQTTLTEHIGVDRSIEEQKVVLSRLAVDCGLDGVVCAAPELKSVRRAIGTSPIIVTPGIRLPVQDRHDQVRVGEPHQALADGADYLVVGRTLTQCEDPEAELASLGLSTSSSS